MADTAAPADQLQAELAELRSLYAAATAENAALREKEASTAAILRVIASSPADLTTVLQTISDAAARRCSRSRVLVRLVEDDQFYVVAVSNWDGPDTVRRRRPLAERAASSEAIRAMRTVHIVDVADPESVRRHPDTVLVGTRTVLHVPLRSDGRAIGLISLARAEVRAFSPMRSR